VPDINRVVFVVEDEGIIAQTLAIMAESSWFSGKCIRSSGEGYRRKRPVDAGSPH
jgi:hypothetical protein